MLLRKGLLKICSKFTGEHQCFIEIAFWHECSPVNLLHIFRTPFPIEQLWKTVPGREAEGEVLANPCIILAATS